MDGRATQKPLVVSPDVFCTPAVRKYESGRHEEERAGRGGAFDQAGQLSNKKLGLAARMERLGHQSTSPPAGWSILAVRDPNVRRGATGPASVKRVSFKDVPLMSPDEGASRPKANSAGNRRPALPLVQHPKASGGEHMSSEGEHVASPGPWTQLMEDMAPEESFTHYLNPLADGDDGEENREAESLEGFAEVQQTPTSQLSRAVDTATSRGVPFHMQTPEAVQVLHKISLHTKAKLDKGSLDRYLRTGPKKLSPEPGMILLAAGTEGEASDQLVGAGERRAVLESSEDENIVDEGAAETCTQKQQLIVASPIGRGLVAADVEGLTDLDQVPPTFQVEHRVRTNGRVTSPVRFSLLGDSPDAYSEYADVGDALGSGSKGRSFSFGMGGDGAGWDTEATAEFLDVHRDPGQAGQDGQDESVDQPNPFGEMLVKLREDPDQIRSPVLRAIAKGAEHEGALAGSPESPVHCTPMNLISTSAAASFEGRGRPEDQKTCHADEAPDILFESSSLDEWLRQRGIEHLSTPIRSDLRKMWDALANIRETTEAYADATRENAQLREQLWETREAELDARADLEEALEVVRIEQDRSRDAACKMAELAMSMHEQFVLLEDERRKLQFDLEQARSLLDRSAGEGTANVMQEMDALKAELERLQVAEMEARKESSAVQNRVTFLEGDEAEKVAFAVEEVADEAFLMHAAGVLDTALDAVDVTDAAAPTNPGPVSESEGSDVAGEIGSHREGSSAEGDVHCKVEFFEHLHADARRGIKLGEPVGPAHLADMYSMSPFDDSPACPHTGIRAPRTTPVEADDETTPYRIHVETMNQFRDTWKDPHTEKETEPGTADEDNSEDSRDGGSDLSDFEVEDIVVSPIDVEDLTRANLRQTVMQRIAAVKSDLASARSRLGHAQSGFSGCRSRAPADVPAEASADAPAEASADAPAEASADAPAEASADVPAETAAIPTALDEIAEEAVDVEDTECPPMLGAFETPGPTPASQSHRSIFARRLDAMSAPLSRRKVAFTPKSGMSSLKSTAHVSPGFSSMSSSSTPLPPSYLQRPVVSRPAPRARHATRREPSAEEDREFRRRAAALNIHVSPYMKRSGRRQMALN